MVYNLYFLAHSLTSHDQSLTQKPGLYTIWKYFKKFLFSRILSYISTQNDLKQILRKIQPVNGVQPWFSGPYFIFTLPIIVPKARVAHHLEVFKNFLFFLILPYINSYICMHSEWSKMDFKQKSTCEWCTTLIFWPEVYLHMTKHCPKSQGCIYIHHLEVFL